MSKPEWNEDTPKWANHLWVQGDGNFIVYCWSESLERKCNALWTTDIDGRDNFKFSPKSWEYVEPRP